MSIGTAQKIFDVDVEREGEDHPRIAKVWAQHLIREHGPDHEGQEPYYETVKMDLTLMNPEEFTISEQKNALDDAAKMADNHTWEFKLQQRGEDE